MIIAFGGLVLLVGDRATPASAPPVLMMAAAGVGWGVYTLLGRGAGDPLGRTARNFIGATPLAVLVALLLGDFQLASDAVWLAIASGVVTSAMGVCDLVCGAAVSQPDQRRRIATARAAGDGARRRGVSGRAVTLKLALASVIILAGVALTIIKPARMD